MPIDTVQGVASSSAAPWEATQTVVATSELPTETLGWFARIGRALRQVVVRPPHPHDGFETPHAHDAAVGLATVAIALAVVATAALRRFRGG